MTMVALILKDGDGSVISFRDGWPTSPGEFFDNNFYWCIIENPQAGLIPLNISKPGPSRPHAAEIRIDDETKAYCTAQGWPIGTLTDYGEFSRWRGVPTVSNVKEPDDDDITWGNA